jgi:outer membrane receptor protein involved in Fe transport
MKPVLLSVCVLYAVLFLGLSESKAQTTAPKDTSALDVLSLEELLNVEIVTATKTATKITDVPAATSVITRQDIQRYGYRSLAEALARIPEAYTHFEGHNWGTDFRGFFANNLARRTLYLINGHRINDRFHFGDFYPDVIGDLQDVEQIEVIRGPGAALYGSVAMTGVVNIITRSWKNLPKEKTTEFQITATADEIAASSLLQKYQISLYQKFSDNVGLSASLYWYDGNSRYDTKTQNASNVAAQNRRPWNSSFASAPGIANFIQRTDAYFDVPNNTFSGGAALPNMNLRFDAGDFTLGAQLHTRLVSWVHPQVNATFNHPNNIRSWGTGAVFAQWNPTSEGLKNLDIMVRVSYNINTNRELSDFSTANRILGANGMPTATSLAANRWGGLGFGTILRNNNGAYFDPGAPINRLYPTAAARDSAANANGGGVNQVYAGIDKSFGAEFQIAPFKSETLNILVGGNYENAYYENLQWGEFRNKAFIGYRSGIIDLGWYAGGWLQAIWTPIKNLTVTAGARYDFQNVVDVYRHFGRNLQYERVGRRDASGRAVLGANGAQIFDTLEFRRQNFIAQDFTPRIAVNYRFDDRNNIRLIYAQAFRAVPPQEIIRLPRFDENGLPLSNPESERMQDIEAIFSSQLTDNFSLTLNAFSMNSNIVYDFNPALAAFARGSGWSNTGGSLAMNFITVSGLELWANATFYSLNRATDAFNFMINFSDTAGNGGRPRALPNQNRPLNSPTFLAKAGGSFRFESGTALAAEIYYNGSIFMVTRTNNNVGDPVPSVANPIQSYAEYNIPSSFSMNLSIRQDLDIIGLKGFFIQAKARNLLGTDVWYVLNATTQDSWNENTFVRPNQLPDFGRQFYIQLGYTF